MMVDDVDEVEDGAAGEPKGVSIERDQYMRDAWEVLLFSYGGRMPNCTKWAHS